MKKINKSLKVFLVTSFIVIAILYNSNNFTVWFYNTVGNLMYYKGNHFLSAIHHQASFDKSKDKNDVFNYNLAGDFYQVGEYEKSLNNYLKLDLDIDSKFVNDAYHNLGNLYYRFGEKEKYDIQKKINLWKKSLLNYNQVLQKKEDKETRENFLFVNKKLNQLLESLKKQNNQNNQNQEKKDEKSKDVENKSDKKDSENKDSSKSEQNQEKEKNQNNSGDNNAISVQGGRGEEYKLGENDEFGNMGKKELEELEKYNQNLKKEQKENSIYFGKKEQKNDLGNGLFDEFLQDPFFGNFKNFDDSILNNAEKDW